MRALVVDDDPGTRRLLARVLMRDHACVITEAADGREALSLVSLQRFDFVLLDLILPGISGVEVLLALRRSPEHRSLPVMILSAVRDERRVREAIRLGISDYVSKPLRAGATAQRVRRFLDSIAGDAPAAAIGEHFPRRPGARLVLIDGDPDFRHFFTAVLQRRYTVAAHATGAEGFDACRAAPPAAVFVGRSLGVLGEARLVARLRALPDLAGTRIVGIGAVEAAEGGVRVDASVPRNFAVEAFVASVARALGPAGEVSLLDRHPGLRRDLLTAAKQVFGMVVATDMELDGDAASDDVDGAGRAARIVLDGAATPGALVLQLRTTTTDAREMAARLLATPAAQLAERAVDQALGEIAGVIGDRLRQALAEEGVLLEAREAVVGTARPDVPVGAGGRIALALRAVDGSLGCHVLLTAPPLTAAAD